MRYLTLRIDDLTFADAQHVANELGGTAEMTIADAVKIGLAHMRERWCDPPTVSVTLPEEVAK